ncbi:MAG TPA: FAD-binding oxidoreductase [Stellaceae bacterium]
MTGAPHAIAGLFRAAAPAAIVVDDADECALASADIAGPGECAAAAILKPGDRDDVEKIVRVARREGVALFPRGGGWSYSGGYTPSRAPAAMVDLSRLTDIAIERDAARVRVGAGTSWGALYAALDGAGLRVPSFGPLSGIGATVGGLVSQNGGFFGTAGHGTIADKSLLGATMVAGSGDTITLTPADRVDGVAAPQPLAGDCGAFGVRTEIALALMPRPATTLFASFAFVEGRDVLAALRALGGIAGLGEAYVFDPGAHANLARSGFSTIEGATLAGDVLKASRNVLSGIADVVRAARWSKTAIASLAWSLHVSVEGDERDAEAALAEVARRATAAGGISIPDVIPRVTRARPFRHIKALLGPEGELWLPTHGVFSLDDAPRGLAAIAALLAERAPIMRAHAIRASILAVLMGDRIVIEPQLFWPDALSPLHRRLVQPDQLASFGDRPGQPAARAMVHELRRALIAALDGAGAAHHQIGRAYAAHPGVADRVKDRWHELKRELDPDRIMNPGVLGL